MRQSSHSFMGISVPRISSLTRSSPPRFVAFTTSLVCSACAQTFLSSLSLHPRHITPISALNTAGGNVYTANEQIRTDVRPISLSRLKDMALQRKSVSSMHSFRSALSSSIRSRDASFATGLRTAWTAPEILSMGQPSTKTDIYALGMTIWELFAKSGPYGEMGGCSDPMELPNQLVNDILNSDLRPTMPDAMPVSIQEAVKDCLSQVTLPP